MVIAIIAFTSLLSISISCLILNRVIESHNEEMLKVLVSYVYDDINRELLRPLIVAQTMTHDRFLIENLKAEKTIPFDTEVEILSKYLSSIKDGFGYSCAAITSNGTMRYYTYKGFHKIVAPLYDEYDIWYKNFVEDGVRYSFDVNHDEINDDIWTLFADARIEDENGNLLGVCAIGMLMENIQTMLAAEEDRYKIKINLVDKNGMIKVDTDSYRIESARIESAIGVEPNAQIILKKLDDVYLIIKYIPEFDWFLVIQRDRNKEIGAFSNLILYLLTGFLVTMAIILSLVQLSVSRKQRQIEEMAKKHGLASHAGMYATMHLIELVENSIHELSRQPKIELMKISDGGDAQTRLNVAVKEMTEPQSQPQMLAFVNLKTLEKRLDGKNIVHNEFLSRKHGWCKAYFIVADQNPSGRINEIVFAIEVIDEEKRRERRLLYLSEIDALTGLRNRGSGEREITDLLSKGTAGMFCLFDADKFKSINDNYGHDVGDKVLKAIAACLKRALRSSDVTMRLGGDEFAAYVIGVIDEAQGRAMINRLFDEIDGIKISEMGNRKITISLGAALFDERRSCTFAELYKKADNGVYASKKSAGNAVTFSSSSNLFDGEI